MTKKKYIFERGSGRVFKRKRRDPKNRDQWIESKDWWIQFYHGRQIRKPAGTSDYDKAISFLKKQLDYARSGKLLPVEAERLKWKDMTATIMRDYRLNERRSIDRVEGAIRHLNGFFLMVKPAQIQKHAIDQYVDYRMEVDKASHATVKYELSIMKRMFHLNKSVFGKIPEFPKIRPANIRKGFFEESEFQAFIVHFDDDLAPAMRFAYLTGWRLQSEIYPLKWSQVDFDAGEIRLDSGTTKNDEGRVFPFSVIPELEAVIRDQKAKTDALNRETRRIIPWVFHRRGEQILDVRHAWAKALKDSKIGHKIPHDFRRTAVRNLERAGVPRSAAMKLVGHKTESMYRRYAIVAKQDLVDGLKHLADYRAGLSAGKKVVSINAKKEGENEDIEQTS